MEQDLLNYTSITKRYIDKLNGNDSGISPDNKKTLLEYHQKLLTTKSRKGRPVRPATIQKNFQDAYFIAQLMGSQSFKNLTKASEEAFHNLEEKIILRWPDSNSNAQRLLALKKVMKLMFKDSPSWIKEMKPGMVGFNPPHPDEICTPLEQQTILEKGTISVKEKAMAAVLRVGIRPSEFFQLKYGDIRDDGEGRAIIYVAHSKTGRTREVPTRSGYVFLMDWLKAHPFKTDDSFLFCNRKGERISAEYLMRINREWFERAGISKKRSRRVYFWRKSAITNWCRDGHPLRVGCLIFDTSLTYMQKTYDAVSKEDVNVVVDAIAGKDPGPKPVVEKVVELSKVCSRCQNSNASFSTSCRVCGWDLSKQNYVDIEAVKKDIMIGLFTKLMEEGITIDVSNKDKIKKTFETIAKNG